MAWCRLFFLFFSFSLFAQEMDIVYTWVDSADPLWQQQRAKYSGRSLDATAAYRFRSRDELKYSLRSIQAFAPYVHKIYIVTNGQKPSWIVPHPKIVFVSHAEIFKDASHLPTFNSMAIESALHRIPGLLEHYVYFNDDVFLGRPTSFYTFFTKENKMKVFITNRPIERDEPLAGENGAGYQRAIRNTDTVLSLHFSKEERFHLAHVPDPFCKSSVAHMAEQFSDIFSLVESHRFRSEEDYALTNGLLPYSIYYMNGAELKKNIDRVNVGLRGDPKRDSRLLKRVVSKRPLFFCIQDLQEEENKKTDQALHAFLEKYFPNKAPWER